MFKFFVDFVIRVLKKSIFILEKISEDNDVKLPKIVPQGKTLKNRLTHISAFTYGNAGDIVLPIALRDTWNISNNSINWESKHIYPIVTDKIIAEINKTKGLIIGGGGLFLKDTNANTISGWQWPCSVEQLDKIKVPFVLYAVGYNRFRGQEEFEPFFFDNITKLAEKCVYLGLRNTGSVNAIKKYIPDELHYKLRFQPCMTTFLSKLYPNICDYSKKEEFIAVNAAFDRPKLRFGEDIGKILTDFAKAIKVLSIDFSIKFYSHMPTDEAFLPYLRALDVKFELVKLDTLHPIEIIKEYSKPRLVIGMRGHAQMIPFGCQTPIVSIVSHNKMQWFLDDIKHPEWGVDVLSQSFREDIINRANSSLSNTNDEINRISKLQDLLYSISIENVNIGLKEMNLL